MIYGDKEYKPGEIRFPDNSAIIQSSNLYLYAGNNPITYSDPSGKFWDTILDLFSFKMSFEAMQANPSFGNAGDLLLDFMAVLIPFVPGSYTVKGLRAAGKVLDGQKALKPVLQSNTKSGALNKIKNLPSDIQSSVKSFFKGGSNSYSNFNVAKTSDGGYIATMTKPGDVPGSYAVYTKVLDKNGNTVSVYKTTIDPKGNIVHVKDK